MYLVVVVLLTDYLRPKFGRCVEESKPVFGFAHFDHVGGALLALIQVLIFFPFPLQ